MIIQISRITTKINNIVFNIEYIINGENAKDFFVEQQGNVGKHFKFLQTSLLKFKFIKLEFIKLKFTFINLSYKITF